MRPTPAETIAGVRRILRDVVEPEVGSEYARARLREVRAVLAQIDWDDAGLQLRGVIERRRALLADAAAWLTSRGGDLTVPGSAAGATFADLATERAAVDAALVEAITRLAARRRSHPDDADADALAARLRAEL